MSAHAATFDPRDLRPPRERGTPRAMALAIVMHALLFAALWFGVAWRSEEPATIEAELWSSLPQTAAPAPRPPVQPPPDPQPAPTPPKPEPAPRVEPPPAKEADIALERKREEARRQEERRKAEETRREQERQAQIERDKQAKAEQKKKEQEKKQAQERFDAELKKLAAMAGEATPAGKPGTGTAAQTSGPRGDATYAGRIAQRIRGNTVFDVPPDLAGNPAVQFRVDLDPAGYVLDVRKTASSGVPGFDAAVERAIRKSEPFPPDATGKPPRSLDIQHRPKDR